MNTTFKTVNVELSPYLQKALPFEAYFEQFSRATERVKQDDVEGHAYPEYFPVNFQRLKRGVKSTLQEPLKKAIERLEEKIIWLVITEFWCGDAAQSIGLLNRVSEESAGKIDLKLVFRDENPELMNAFLTNGSKSIPKIIQLDEHLQLSGQWGPRPKPAQTLVMEYLAKGERYNDPLHLWYARDKGQHLQQEIASLLQGS